MFLWVAEAWQSEAWPLQIFHLPQERIRWQGDFGNPPARAARLTEIKNRYLLVTYDSNIFPTKQMSHILSYSLNRGSEDHWSRVFTACSGSVGNVLISRGQLGYGTLDRPVLGNCGGKYCYLQKIRAPHSWGQLNQSLPQWCWSPEMQAIAHK